MSPWNRILNYGVDINRKIGTTLTTEKAKKIRKNLLVWGAVVSAIGAIGIVVGMIVMFSGFVKLADGAFDDLNNSNDYSANCPEMGEPGWFECNRDASRQEFNDSSARHGQQVSYMIKSMFGGFGLVAFFAILSSLGAMMIKAGLTIVIAGEGAKFLDTAPKCPECGDPVEENEIYCNKCGADLRNKTKCSCGTQNDVEDKFCRNCGKKLGE